MLKKIKGALVAVPAALAVVAIPAHAAVPTQVSTALGDMQADGVSVATLVLVALVAVVAFKFMRKGL